VSRLPRLLALTLVALVAALVAGCSGGGEDMTEGRTPAQLLDEAVRQAQALDTYRVAIGGTLAVGTQGAGGAVANLTREPIEIEGEGRADPPERAAVDATVNLSGLPVQVSVTKVGGELYIGAIGQDIRLDVPAAQVESFDPGLLLPTLARWMTDPEETAREDVEGEPAVRLSGRVDPEAVLADIGPLLGSTAGAPDRDAVADALRDGTVDVWVGTEDLRPRRVRVDLRVPDARALSPQLRSLTVDLTVTVTGYDEPVQIEAPADARVLGLDELGGLAGG
jgi:hypothetical protein